MAAPYYPRPGRGECAQACADHVTYVWAHNPAAFIGMALCALLLAAWLATGPLNTEERPDDGR